MFRGTEVRPTDEVNGAMTMAHWHAWLLSQAESNRAVYRQKPSLLIADHLRERAITQDYEGREILELLQNANDAAAEARIAGKVLIELSKDGLLVANSGAPFSAQGIESLQTDHLS